MICFLHPGVVIATFKQCSQFDCLPELLEEIRWGQMPWFQGLLVEAINGNAIDLDTGNKIFIVAWIVPIWIRWVAPPYEKE